MTAGDEFTDDQIVTTDNTVDIYALLHQHVGKEAAAAVAGAIEAALGLRPPPADYTAVSAALHAYAAAKGAHWDAENDGRWTLADLIADAERVECMFASPGISPS